MVNLRAFGSVFLQGVDRWCPGKFIRTKLSGKFIRTRLPYKATMSPSGHVGPRMSGKFNTVSLDVRS